MKTIYFKIQSKMINNNLQNVNKPKQIFKNKRFNKIMMLLKSIKYNLLQKIGFMIAKKKKIYISFVLK